jgi:hypothetical protein
MKTFYLFILFISISTLSVSNAQSIVSGGIYQNTTWSLEGSPYILNGSVVVFPGNTLTIEPGVVILINNEISNDFYIETRGTLNMVGSDQLPIKIQTQFDTTNIGWQGFKCISSQGGTLNADRFRISNAQIPFEFESPLSLYQYTNCSFSHCGQAVTVGNEIILDNCQFFGNDIAIYGWSYFTLNNCSFINNQIAINAYSTSFNLTNTTFTENTNAVVFSSGVFDTMLIQNCIFQDNDLAISSPNHGVVENCSFLNNIIGIQGAYSCEINNNILQYNALAVDVSFLTKLFGNQINNNNGGVRISAISDVLNAPVITNNEICGNLNFNIENNTNVNYSLLTNCFCGIDSTAIEELIIDGYDDITKGLINYQEFDSSCSTILSTVMKFNESASIGSLETEKLQFSNPVGSNLEFFVSYPIHEIELSDLTGQKIGIHSMGNNQFEMSTLKQGLYIIKSVNKQVINQKIIKL